VADRDSAARGEALLAWHGTQDRPLPWRHDTDPYRVLVREVMLQQTQASRIGSHLDRFLELFPTVDTLAEASLGDVLAAWSGLGYNQRARRLREAARRIIASGWPATPGDLERLPGVGPYTAAAVASFAFGAQVAAIDTNVRRVLSRWAGAPLDDPALRQAASGAMRGPAASWNQAMMDLGATVCVARDPRCGHCPVSDWCAGPEGYTPPARAQPFAGSDRQVRGLVIRHLMHHGPSSIEDIESESGVPALRIADVAAHLADDGLVTVSGRWVTVAD
jgi:A/G-specific adenine glycosylase